MPGAAPALGRAALIGGFAQSLLALVNLVLLQSAGVGATRL